MVPAALTLLGILGASTILASPQAPTAPSTVGVRIVVEGLDLALTTPDRWRITPESGPLELVLAAGSERGRTTLRVRRSLAERSPREHLREFALELGSPFERVEFTSEAQHEAGPHTVRVVHAADPAGRDGLQVRLFVVRLAAEGEHLFWLDGTGRDVQRAFPEILACVGGATAATGPVRRVAASDGSAAIRHRASGLVVERHPAGFAPRAIEPADLDGDGLNWLLEGPDGVLAQLVLTRRSVAPLVDEASAAGSLGTELRNDPAVSELTSSRERLASQPARRVTWRRAGPAGGRSHETWFFKSGSSLFRLDLVAQPAWLVQNEAALEDFRRGLRFAEQE